MNRIIGIELSHRYAPIDVREQLALNSEQTEQALQELKKIYQEVFIISTCNRLSLYAFGDSYLHLEEYLERFGKYSQYLTVLPDTKIAVQNLFSTAAGLESQAIGEHQIVGQIRDALDLARKNKTIGPILDEFIRQAVHVGKRTRIETNIGKHSASLATVGFELINKHNFNLKECDLLVVGTGNMANLVNTVLDRSSINKLFIASHNLERASEMATEWQGEAVHVSKLPQLLAKVDIIIGGTQGEVNLLAEKEIENSKCTRAQFAASLEKPKLLIDFGLPRNFNPNLKKLDHIHLYDLDDIKKMTFESLLKRHNEIPQVKEIIKDEVTKFTEAYYQRRAAPVVEAFWNGLNDTKEKELKWLMPKMGDVTEEQKKLIEKFAHRMIRKISKNPIEQMHKMSQNLHFTDNPINTVKKVFNLDKVELFVPKRRVIVGTRGSKLALTQTTHIIEQLKKLDLEIEYVTKVIRTSGDDGNIEVMGAFTSAIQRALLNKTVDIAVHSYKDLPIEQVPGLMIAAISKREDVRDALLSNSGKTLRELPGGSIVGTGSLRRQIQIQQIRPDIKVKFIQGNLDGRIKKMKDGGYDAIILAVAGLKRLGMLDQITEYLTEEEMIPAVCQGALALEIRESDEISADLVQKINDKDIHLATDAERSFLTACGGGCNFPLAAFAQVNGNSVHINALYASGDSTVVEIDSIQGHKNGANRLAEQLAVDLMRKVRDRRLAEKTYSK